ncbi:MAG: DUF448 domain-containing protein, partial [Pseudomonadota bacterium]
MTSISCKQNIVNDLSSASKAFGECYAREQANLSLNRPMRKSALTHERACSTEMLRFVLSPEKTVTFDIKRQLPGRGVWLLANQTEIHNAIKKNMFKKIWPDCHLRSDMVEFIESALLNRAL